MIRKYILVSGSSGITETEEQIIYELVEGMVRKNLILVTGTDLGTELCAANAMHNLSPKNLVVYTPYNKFNNFNVEKCFKSFTLRDINFPVHRFIKSETGIDIKDENSRLQRNNFSLKYLMSSGWGLDSSISLAMFCCFKSNFDELTGELVSVGNRYCSSMLEPIKRRGGVSMNLRSPYQKDAILKTIKDWRESNGEILYDYADKEIEFTGVL